MASAGIDIRRRGRGKLCVGAGPSTALCWNGNLQ